MEAQDKARKALGTWNAAKGQAQQVPGSRYAARQPDKQGTNKVQKLEAQVRELQAKLDVKARSSDARGTRPALVILRFGPVHWPGPVL